MSVAPTVLVDGRPEAGVPVTDRGLLYGDGLFETVRVERGKAPLWARHLDRLRLGCERLGLPLPAPERLLDDLRTAASGHDNAGAVVRITVTRGDGNRGYAPPRDPQCRRIVAAFALPGVPAAHYRDGVRVRWCTLRLAEQGALAGIKHLNRLEQVLARAEWDDPGIADGLLCDAHGKVVCATAANLFAVIDGRLATPPVDRCGVAGVARAQILATRPDAQVRELSGAELAGASEVFLSSAVRGILPVRRLDDTVWPVGPVARALQRDWRALGFSTEAG